MSANVGKGSELPLSTNEKEPQSQDIVQPVSPTTVTAESNFPSLRYDIASKKQSIAISALIILLVNGFTPAVVYYILQYGTLSSRTIVITAVEVPASLTLIHWPYRLWLLKKRKGENSPKDAGMFTWDAFQWNFVLGVAQVTTFCVVAGIKESMRWYMFSFVGVVGISSISFLVTWILARKGIRLPVRISSVPAGSVCRPGIYHLIEDITACEGAGGREYRERLNVRWESSFIFRELLSQITLVFGISLLLQTAVQFVILFATPEKVFVGLSTVLLWTWFGLTLLWGWRYSQLRIRHEEEKWRVGSGNFEA